MMLYVLICLSLSLAGVCAVQFFYLAYLGKVEEQHKRRIRELEKNCRYFKERLREAELQLANQAELLEEVYGDFEDEEVWADVIDDR